MNPFVMLGHALFNYQPLHAYAKQLHFAGAEIAGIFDVEGQLVLFFQLIYWEIYLIPCICLIKLNV